MYFRLERENDRELARDSVTVARDMQRQLLETIQKENALLWCMLQAGTQTIQCP